MCAWAIVWNMRPVSRGSASTVRVAAFVPYLNNQPPHLIPEEWAGYSTLRYANNRAAHH